MMMCSKMTTQERQKSLCDNCTFAIEIGGAGAWYTDGKTTYSSNQRYCQAFSIAIHFYGKQECHSHNPNNYHNDEGDKV